MSVQTASLHEVHPQLDYLFIEVLCGLLYRLQGEKLDSGRHGNRDTSAKHYLISAAAFGINNVTAVFILGTPAVERSAWQSVAGKSAKKSMGKWS